MSLCLAARCRLPRTERMGTQDVEGEAPQDGEVLGGLVLSGADVVLAKDHVERPAELVLDGPVRPHGLHELAP